MYAAILVRSSYACSGAVPRIRYSSRTERRFCSLASSCAVDRAWLRPFRIYGFAPYVPLSRNTIPRDACMKILVFVAVASQDRTYAGIVDGKEKAENSVRSVVSQVGRMQLHLGCLILISVT